MQIILLTTQKLVQSGERDALRETLWWDLYRTAGVVTLQVWPYKPRPGIDILLPNCEPILGRFGAVAGLVEPLALEDEIVERLGALGPALICIADETLAPLALLIKQRCPQLTLCFFTDDDDEPGAWQIFSDIFDEIIPYSKGIDALVTRFPEMAEPPRQHGQAPVYPLDAGHTYNPFTQFCSTQYFYGGTHTGDKLDVAVCSPDGIRLPNIMYSLIRARGYSVIEIKGVLPVGLRPDDIRLRIGEAEQPSLYDGALSTSYRVERCGILAVEQADEKSYAVDWWAGSPEAGNTPPEHTVTRDKGHVLLGRSLAQDTIPMTVETNSETCRFSEHRELYNGHHGDDLSRFRDIHKGRTAWLIGNGPSVRTEDLEKLQGELTFGFNRLYLAYENMRFRPSYLVCGDTQMIEDFGEEMARRAETQVFYAQPERPDVRADFTWLRRVNCFPSVFSRDASRFVSPGGSTVYVTMQLAYYMGVRQFRFYGADFRYEFSRDHSTHDLERSASGEGNHFIPNYRSGMPWSPPELRNITSSFLAADILLRSEGGSIKNVTRGGLLEIFARADFDDALAASQGDAR